MINISEADIKNSVESNAEISAMVEKLAGQLPTNLEEKEAKQMITALLATALQVAQSKSGETFETWDDLTDYVAKYFGGAIGHIPD